MTRATRPIAVQALEVAPRAQATSYPEPFAALMAGRQKRPLGDVFGLANFGVNLTRIAPGGSSALRHAHSAQDELVYILQGEAILVCDAGEAVLTPGMCAGFRAGDGNAHHLLNRGSEALVYLEIGDRSAGDAVSYPDDDIVAATTADGRRAFTRKDGSPY